MSEPKHVLKIYVGHDPYSCQKKLKLEIETEEIETEFLQCFHKHCYSSYKEFNSYDKWFIFKYKKLINALNDCLEKEQNSGCLVHTIIGIIGSDVTVEEGGIPWNYYRIEW